MIQKMENELKEVNAKLIFGDTEMIIISLPNENVGDAIDPTSKLFNIITSIGNKYNVSVSLQVPLRS